VDAIWFGLERRNPAISRWGIYFGGKVSNMQLAGSVQGVEPVAGAANGAATDGAAETWVLFLIDGQTYALQIGEVERIVRAVEVKPLPESPPYVRGIVNVQGRVLPVVDLRLRFGQPSRDVRPEDHFIIARTPTLSVILPVDAALGSREVSGAMAPLDRDARGRAVRKVVPLDLGVVYSLDLERVVFGDESPTESQLGSVLAELQAR
jgi:purine-binding chemotaxis protein CheW